MLHAKSPTKNQLSVLVCLRNVFGLLAEIQKVMHRYSRAQGPVWPRDGFSEMLFLVAQREIRELGRYSPLVRRKETDRIIGAASTTTGSIAAHETTQDNSQ